MNECYHTEWTERNTLPVAVVRAGTGHPQAHHPLAGWRLKANVYLDGSVRLFSGEFGSVFFNRAPFHEGAQRIRLVFGDRTEELDLNRLGARLELGIGTFSAQVNIGDGILTQRVVLPDLNRRELLIAFEWSGNNAPELCFPIETPVSPGAYGSVFYRSNREDAGQEEGWIRARLTEPLVIRAGYDPEGGLGLAPTIDDVAKAFAGVELFWRERFARLQTDFTGDRLRELKWSVALMIATCIHDGTRNQLACTNGAIYSFNHLAPELDQRGIDYVYSFRDGNQVAFAIVDIFPEVAREQILRNFTAFRPDLGIPQASNAVPGATHHYKTPGSDLGQVFSVGFASDQAYWLIKALTQYIRVTGEFGLLDLRLPDAVGEEKPIREHLQEMLRFADETVGYGPHGLCRFLSGDWSDYLDEIGARGKGESFMNCALNIIAKSRLAWVYEQVGAAAEAASLRTQAGALRARVESHLAGPWYPRAFDDAGQLVGGADDRIFVEVQSWLALAKCGSPEFRRTALRETVARCLDRAGMLIMDKPLQPEERPGRTRIPYAPGTGENGGLWWLTGYWVAMALEQEGLRDEGLAVYDACSMDNHHRLFPEVWWSPWMCPDGIDGPSSKNYGQAQQPPGFNRESNPNEVAKFAYKLCFATRTGLGASVCW